MWQDALCNIKKNNPKDYKWMSITLITMFNALNIMALFVLFNALFPFRISIFDNIIFSKISKIDSLIKFFLLFYVIPLTINYLLIFYKKNDIVLMQNFNNRFKGKLFVSYGLISIFTVMCSVIISYILL